MKLNEQVDENTHKLYNLEKRMVRMELLLWVIFGVNIIKLGDDIFTFVGGVLK